MDNNEPKPVVKKKSSPLVEVIVGDSTMLMTEEERAEHMKNKMDGMIDDK